jgi:hypothetical protein
VTMRVRYTIPGIGPGPDIPDFPPTVSGPSFRSRLRRLGAALPGSWRKLLALDEPQIDATFIPPPPRPFALDTDLAGDRARWRDLLDRHAREMFATRHGDSSDRVQRMMALLMHYHGLQDSVVARRLSEPGE